MKKTLTFLVGMVFCGASLANSFPVIHVTPDTFMTKAGFNKTESEIKKNSGASVVVVDINSPGGSVEMMQQIIADLKALPGKKIMKADGFVASAAADTLFGVSKYILIEPDSYIIIHDGQVVDNKGVEHIVRVDDPNPDVQAAINDKWFQDELNVYRGFLSATEIDAMLHGIDLGFPAELMTVLVSKDSDYKLLTDKDLKNFA